MLHKGRENGKTRKGGENGEKSRRTTTIDEGSERRKPPQGGSDAAAAASPPLLLLLLLPLKSCAFAAFQPTSHALRARAAGSSFSGFVFSRNESSPPALSIVRRAVVVTGRRTCFPAAESQRDFCWTLGFQVRRELGFVVGGGDGGGDGGVIGEWGKGSELKRGVEVEKNKKVFDRPLAAAAAAFFLRSCNLFPHRFPPSSDTLLPLRTSLPA